MLQRLAIVLLVLGLPATTWAQKGPERLLPPGSQVYVHWDGFDKHKEAYAKTALAKTMRGDLGKFVRTMLTRGTQMAQDLMAAQLDPEVANSLKDGFLGVLNSTSKHGFTLGVEVRKLEPPEVQAVLFLPGGGAPEKSLLSLLRASATLAQQEVENVTVGGRKLHHMSSGPMHFIWWAEGKDAVVAVGTDGPAALFKHIGGKGKSLASAPLFKEVQQDEGETKAWARGYLDLGSLAKVASAHSEDAAKLVGALGLDGLKSVTFRSGFEGAAELGVVDLHLSGPRKGLLKLLPKKSFTLADLPALPDDVTGFSASSIETAQIYPVTVKAVEDVVRLVAPEKLPQVQDGLKQFEKALGVQLGDELFGSFDNLMVSYSAWAEGPLGLGQVTAFKLKDADQLEKALSKIIDSAGQLPFAQVSVKKSTYRGATIHQLQLSVPGGQGVMAPLPCYAIHKGWFVVSSYPQPIQGFILRSNGDLPAWKVSGDIQKALEPFPKEFISVSVSDPRPTLKMVLSLTPTALTYANLFLQQLGQQGFDVGLVPNAYEATQHLFPNVSVTTYDGKRLRSITRSSLPLPF